MVADALLSWFDTHARDLPWRIDFSHLSSADFLNRLKVLVGEKPHVERLRLRRDPYAVVVSELMLQQTQVSAVIPYYERFMGRFPTVEELADACETEVLKLWEGLGYYRRARFLSALAKYVVEHHDGIIPPDKKILLSLPGIGKYTAGAILSFAYDLPEPAVDGNVVRVFSRLDAQPHVRGDAKAIRTVRDRVRALIPEDRAGDFNEAVMDLGATVCTPSTPDCAACPLQNLCQAYVLDSVELFPVRKDIEERPVDRFSYVLFSHDDLVYVQRRPKGLLEGLYEFYPVPRPYGAEEEASFRSSLNGELDVPQGGTLLSEGGHMAEKVRVNFIGDRKAVYSHRIWEVSCWEVDISTRPIAFPSVDTDIAGEWVTLEELSELPFPAVLVSWRDAFIARRRGGSKDT